MKTILLTLLFILGILFVSCNNKKEAHVNDKAVNDTITIEKESLPTEAPVKVIVRGRVAEIIYGKDGYTARINDDSGKQYFATISRVNLDDPKQYKDVKQGDLITVKGESFKVDGKLYIKVHELK